MSSTVVVAPLVYVRTPAGTVQLHEGDAVPVDADSEHVAHLLERGLLSQKRTAGSHAGDDEQ